MLRRRSSTQPIKLHLGCGAQYFSGWRNVDKESKTADERYDVTRGLRYPDDSVQFIYSEHFLEHLTVRQAVEVLQESHRVLRPGGVMRIATPDLAYLVDKYASTSWKDQDWITTYGYEWIQTRAEMLNLCFREWGHQHLYDAEELERRLREAGFEKIASRPRNVSPEPELANRETRRDSRLIVEAVK